MPQSHEAHPLIMKTCVIYIWRGCNSQGVVHLWKAHSAATGGEEATISPTITFSIK
jgi:hypothetical protein